MEIAVRLIMLFKERLNIKELLIRILSLCIIIVVMDIKGDLEITNNKKIWKIQILFDNDVLIILKS